MVNQVLVGLTAEGKTDYRFFENLITKLLIEIGYDCKHDINFTLIPLVNSEQSYTKKVIKAAEVGKKDFGISILVIHKDADSNSDESTFKSSIIPAQKAVSELSCGTHCLNIVALVPVQMTEAWMLADRELLKEQIGTKKSDEELGILKRPESYTNPKKIIEEAIRIARSELTKRRRGKLELSELYLPIGQKISLEKLDKLESYRKFKESVRDAFRKLNLLD